MSRQKYIVTVETANLYVRLVRAAYAQEAEEKARKACTGDNRNAHLDTTATTARAELIGVTDE